MNASSKRSLLARLRSAGESGVLPVMARREAGRVLFWERSHQGVALGVAAACVLAVLIPLHRLYGVSPRPIPYLLVFAMLVQAALLISFARAVWAGMRQDAATGSLDELRLTGAEPQVLLLGKWLGAAAAGAVWALMLAPGLILAGAFTGEPPGRLAAVLVAWMITPAVGAMLGVLASLSEKGSFLAAAPVGLLFQVWIFTRLAGPRLMAGAGPAAQELLHWIHQLDPITLVPSALGRVREPWMLKVLFLALVILAVVVWLAGADRDLPEYGRARTGTGDFLSLRPLREWLAQTGESGAGRYGRDPVFQFERAHGWRLRVSPPAWLFLLAFTALPAIPAAILGEESGPLGPVLFGIDMLVAGIVGGLGMAACLAAEREQGRWELLLCAPLQSREIVLGKWRAVWLESWPLWAAAGLRSLVLAVGGSLPWTLVPLCSLGPVLGAGGAAAVSAALCLRAPSLTAAQQRAAAWALVPTIAVLAARLLLPELPNAEWLSPAHWAVLAERSPAGVLTALGAMLAYGALAAASLGLAVRSVRAGGLE